MSDLPLQGRIFLVGVPRSGTTLLQALLSSHSAITSFTESHFFSRPFRVLPGIGPVLHEDPTPLLQSFLAENHADSPPAAHWFGPPTPRALGSALGRPLESRKVARRLRRVLDELAAARGAPLWLEKTPRHLHAIPLLERVCDDGLPTRFVHLVRDGLQTVASLFTASKQWERAYDLDECVRRWNDDLALTARYLGSPGHQVITYEDLTAAPERVLRAVLEEWDLPWEPDMLAQFGAEAAELTSPGEAWKADVARPIRPSATADQVLDGAQRASVQAQLNQARYDALAARAIGARDTSSP